MTLDKQYIIKYEIQSKYEEDFVISSDNRYIFTSVTNCTNNWGVDPYKYSILLVGPKASGKTHLANIWRKNYGSIFLDKIDQEPINAPGYIIENIERYPQEELLHIFNIIHEMKKYLLLTSKITPQFDLQDLQSRLNSIRRFYLSLPDENTTIMLLMHHFSSRSLKVGMDVVEYLAKRITRSYDNIEHVVDMLDNMAIRAKKEININLASKFIQNYNL